MSTPQEATETAWQIHTALGEWTARVDAKASFALTLESAATAGIIALSTDDHMFAHLHGWGVRAPLWAGTNLILIGGIFATLVVVPRLRSAKDLVAEAPNHFIYFGHLRHREAGELTTALLQTDVLPVLSQQLINMSDIAWRKHRHVQWSFICFGLGAVTVFVAGLFS
ncbi:Pycsar system effector family protein [Streptomyces sp. NPDC053086]|uniref:Pycsar system effector family protein n=1 Tax=unclassified Streptomyces TaxID=2593676 RepID=UPI0037D332EA